MKKVLKTKFNEKLHENWIQKSKWGTEPATAEETHGIVMLFTELSTNSIGFQGFGFFTLSYSLTGSVGHS